MKFSKILTILLFGFVFFAFLSASSGFASSQEQYTQGLDAEISSDGPNAPFGPSGIVSLGSWRNIRPTESYLHSVSLLPENYSVDCSSPGQTSQGWIVGNVGTILTYCNGVWDHAIAVESIPTNLYGVQALEPELGVAVGDQGAVLMYLWDFIAQDWVWTKSPIPVGNKRLYAVSMVPDGSGGYSGWVVGNPENGKGTLLYGTATPTSIGGNPTFSYTWENRTLNYSNLPDVDLYFDVHMLTPNNGWAVGGVHGVKGVIIHWNGSTWSLFQEVGTDSLRGLYMLSANEGWASGASGEIFHFNGSTWSQVSSPTNELLYSIAFSPDEQEGWIVGENGTLLKYSGSNWVPFTDLRTDPFDFWGVDFASGHGWIAGYHNEFEIGGHILEYADDLWLAVTPPTDNRLNALSIISDTDAWAVGHADEFGSAIVHWDGRHWQRWYQNDPPLPDAKLFAIDMVSSTEGWLAGDPVNPGEPSVFLYWDGVRWAPPRYNAPLNVRVKDIDMLDSSFGWAVAQEGNAVAKYDSFSGYWSANPTCQGVFYNLRNVSIIPDDNFFGWDAWAVGQSTNPSSGEYFMHYQDGCAGGYAWETYQWPDTCPDLDPKPSDPYDIDLHGIQMVPNAAGNWGFAVGNFKNRGAIYYYDEGQFWWTTDWCIGSGSLKLPSKLYAVDIVEESGIAWFGGYNTDPISKRKVAWIRFYDELGHGDAGVPFPVNGVNIYHRPIASLKMSSDTMGWAVGDREQSKSVIYQYPYPNFTLEGMPEARAVQPGGTATYQISAYSSGGFNANVSLDVISVPSGSSYTISPTSIDTTIDAQLDILTTGSTPLGTYFIPVEGYAVFHSGDNDIPVWRYQLLRLTVTNHPVTDVDPLSGPAGTIVTIKGTNFGSDPGAGNRSTAMNHVILAGQQMPDSRVISWSNTQIQVRVPDSPTLFPEGPVTGEVKVMVAGEYSNADFNFQLKNQINELSYDDSGTEYIITLTGTSFGNDPGSLYRNTTLENVSLGGNRISSSNVTSWSNNTITFVVPNGTPAGQVIVTSNGYQSNSLDFNPPGSGGSGTLFLPLTIR